MTLPQLLPDLDKALVAYLKSVPELTTAGCQRISTHIGKPYPMLRVTTTGGPSDGRRLWSASVQIEAWGGPDVDDEATVTTIARTALAAIDALPAATLTDVAVSWVAHATTLQWLPDLTTNQQRRLSSVVIYAHSKP